MRVAAGSLGDSDTGDINDRVRTAIDGRGESRCAVESLLNPLSFDAPVDTSCS
jgi:hypothetical protein